MSPIQKKTVTFEIDEFENVDLRKTHSKFQILFTVDAFFSLLTRGHKFQPQIIIFIPKIFGNITHFLCNNLILRQTSVENRV